MKDTAQRRVLNGYRAAAAAMADARAMHRAEGSTDAALDAYRRAAALFAAARNLERAETPHGKQLSSTERNAK